MIPQLIQGPGTVSQPRHTWLQFKAVWKVLEIFDDIEIAIVSKRN